MEGCGDCGVKSNCLSQPIKTEFGRKTQIDQPSCNKDYSVWRELSSFIQVIPSEKDDKRKLPSIEFDFNSTKSEQNSKNVTNIFMLGIGGTGVVTVNQIISTAAFIEDKKVIALDQTGLSQKGGSVVSHLKIVNNDKEYSSRVANGESDAYLVFDVLTGKSKEYGKIKLKNSTSVISTSEIPTGDMVRSTAEEYPEASFMIDLIKEYSKNNTLLNATELSEHFFGSNMQANFIVIGAANLVVYQFQVNLLKKHEMNGVAVSQNTNAFNIGRKVVSDPHWIDTIDLYRSKFSFKTNFIF